MRKPEEGAETEAETSPIGVAALSDLMRLGREKKWKKWIELPPHLLQEHRSQKAHHLHRYQQVPATHGRQKDYQ